MCFIDTLISEHHATYVLDPYELMLNSPSNSIVPPPPEISKSIQYFLKPDMRLPCLGIIARIHWVGIAKWPCDISYFCASHVEPRQKSILGGPFTLCEIALVMKQQWIVEVCHRDAGHLVISFHWVCRWVYLHIWRLYDRKNVDRDLVGYDVV
jgi:hypothetical protein